MGRMVEYRWKIQKQQILTPQPIICPEYSEKLAEFIGIMLGDGGITKYQVIITLNGDNEKEYISYVKNLIVHLFNTPPSINKSHRHGCAVNISVSRSELVKNCNKLGLVTGNKIKQNCKVPEWVFQNKIYQIACLRGLIDTDGCIFLEQHTIKDRKYSYTGLNFTSYSPSLISDVNNIFRNLGFNAVLRRNNKSVQVENKAEICKYFKVVGTSNSRHLERFERFITETKK